LFPVNKAHILISTTLSTADLQKPDYSEAKIALDNVLGSQVFSEMSRLRRFLEYVVSETIEGRGDRLKGVVIACDVFDKTDPDEAQSTTIVRVEAGRLRRRLDDYYRGEGRNDPLRIKMPKGGYVVAFEKMAANAAKPVVHPDEAKTGLNWFANKYPVLIGVVLIALLAIFLSWNRDTTGTEGRTAVILPSLSASKPLIAVLPFKNMVSDDPDDSIAYGLTEDIITDLGNLSSLEVISLTSLLPFKDLDIKPLDINEKLGVHYVLNGSVRGTSPDLRVTAQLYDATNGVQLWGERFDRKMTNELLLQGELARQVVDSLSIQLRNDETLVSEQRRNVDPETWSLYKQAINLVNPPSDPARLDLSLLAFEQVMQQDPGFAGGYAGAAYVYSFKAFFGHDESIDLNARTALQLAELAQTQDPSFGLSYSAQAFAYLANRDFEQALIASQKAIQLTPNDPYVMTYHGFVLCASGESEKGIAFVETALRLDPLNARTPYLNILGVINFYAGHYEKALLAFKRNRERGGPLGPGIQHFVAASYAALGDSARASATLNAAGLLENADHNWENWARRSWKNQEDSDHILEMIEQIRQKGT
jgi:adenylate cyclase